MYKYMHAAYFSFTYFIILSFLGISKFRGTICYELAMTKAALLVNQLEESGMTDNLHHLAKVSVFSST